MGLCYETSRWLDRLWAEHLDASAPARDLVQAGVLKQGDGFAGFPADLHARLYLPRDPASREAPDWATRLHGLASELGEWQRLREMCARNGFAAGIAAEAMLGALLPHVPDKAPEPPHEIPQPDGVGGRPDAASGPQEGLQGSPQGPSDADLRAALRKATREARDAVHDAEADLEGLGTPLGFSTPGTSVARSPGPADLKRIRQAHARLQASPRLRRIVALAGRMERVAAAKARSEVRPGVGEVHGIEPGGDLSRVLPSELVMLRHPRLRLLALSRLLQRRALSYAMTGREPQARGPIVVLLDESASMREDGRDIWSTAAALALLSTATRQKKAWHLVGFNAAITREVAIPVGQASLDAITEALDKGCSGGTDFDAPVLRAAAIIRTSRVMKRADVVIITDGEDSLEPATVEAARELTRGEGVSWFVVGVGAEASLRSLEAIATSTTSIRDTTDAECIGPVCMVVGTT
jgi:Mg-chelatase subunit ChlD